MRFSTSFIVLFAAIFGGCKIENRSPDLVAQKFLEGFDECPVNPPNSVVDYVTADSQLVAVPMTSLDVTCPVRDVKNAFKAKNPNRYVIGAERRAQVKGAQVTLGVMVYSREYPSLIPVSDTEIRDKSRP